MEKSILAKAKSLRGIELIAKAFDAWGDQIPDDSAFPARLSTLTGADWAECKDKYAAIKIIIKEAIPYLKASKDIAGNMQTILKENITPLQHTEDRRDSLPKSDTEQTSSTQSTPTLPTAKATGGFEEFVLGDGIRVYLPKDNIKIAWEKTKKALKVLIEESDNS